ncbi:hypothetical protein KC19_3G076400 [Ceratodon purpureus]|uniref:Protein kinase domain-containing protein n=1 Tax=Ceratodon purpureus TaxID=3225 RepID=A0A8T0IIN4_CERPU|nr:hypothetical protein KC19_3G076400 [Ceratodon purpureus]
MADYYSHVMDCINHVQTTVHGRSAGASTFLLNKRQCEYLAQELLKVSESLEARGAESLEQGMQRTVLLHLHATVKRAQVLVTRCCCESSSWLAAAVALGDTKGEVISILLGLRQWSFLLDMAICASSGGIFFQSSQQLQDLLETGEETYQRLSKQKSKMQNAIEDAAHDDQEELFERIATSSLGGQEDQHDEDYIRGVYLKSQLIHTKGDLQSVEGLKAHTILSALGSGAYGMVMKVKWLGQEVALKILKEITRAEATLLGQVQHPNIVRLFHYWEELTPKPHSRIIMELMPSDLQQHIENVLGKRAEAPLTSKKGVARSMPFSLPVAIDTMLQVAQAMRQVHEKRLTHRDLKTSNILVKPMGEEYLELHTEGYLEVKLADFGSSKAYTNSSISGDLTRNTGTTLYGAPEIFGKEEIARERNFPPKADVWSFGMTCSEILTGEVPFADDTARSTLHKRIMKNGLRPRLPKECPEYLRFCIKSCWELQPQRRPSFPDLCRMLKHAKLLSLGLMDVEGSKGLFAYQTSAGVLKASVLSLQPLEDSMISRFGFDVIWRNLRGAGVSLASRHISTDSRGQSQLHLLTKLFKSRSKRRELLALNEKFEEFDMKPIMFSYNELRAATKDFHSDMELVRTGFAVVYKGVLRSGHVVAVTSLLQSEIFVRTVDDFANEIALISRMNHRNLVKMKGCCVHEDHRLLVYEYVDNLNVAQIVLGWPSGQLSARQHVSWPQRVNICLGVARGLHYLHELAFPRIVHRDIKPSNILLDHNLEPKIANFGLALLFPDLEINIEADPVKATPGYLAPEYFISGQVSDKVDVFGFGVTCLQVISGRSRCIDYEVPEGQKYLVKYAFRLHREGRLMELIDRTLDLSSEDDVLWMIHVSLLCVQRDPERRPTMGRVVSMLQRDTKPEVQALLDDASNEEWLP